jgi:hypothetical protein
MAKPLDPSTFTDNQKLFVRAAKRAGLDVFSYSGRGMHGDVCPAVTVRNVEEIRTRAKVTTDSMGMDVVVYARS